MQVGIYREAAPSTVIPLPCMIPQSVHTATPTVLLFSDIHSQALENFLYRYGLKLQPHPAGTTLPGSFWGDSEAGLIGNVLHARPDTPVHSILHEACHYICMDSDRRRGLDTNAGGDYNEENAVCYLQILLADELAGMDRQRMWKDMDAWGYSFRLGSAQGWFEQDADDARAWLRRHGLIDAHNQPTWQLRAQTGRQSMD